MQALDNGIFAKTAIVSGKHLGEVAVITLWPWLANSAKARLLLLRCSGQFCWFRPFVWRSGSCSYSSHGRSKRFVDKALLKVQETDQDCMFALCADMPEKDEVEVTRAST